MGCAEFAVGLVIGAQQAAQFQAGREIDAVRHAAQRRVGCDPHDRHGWGRRQKMRVNHLQQRLSEGRKLRFHLQLNPRREKRETLKQAFYIGIGDIDAGEIKAAGDLRKFGCEFLAHVAQKREFTLVMLHQPRVHYWVPSATTACRVSTSMDVSKNRRTGKGCAHSSPSISKTSAGLASLARDPRSWTRTESGLIRGS